MKLIIVDRDGVINYDSDAYIKSPDEWHPIPAALTALATLKQLGYHVAIASNQSGINRGFFDIATLEAIHQKMLSHIEKAGGTIDYIQFCPHTPDENCQCRKPKPGLLLNIANYFNISLENTYMVGDSIKDLQAAIAAGAKPILVKTGKGTKSILALSHHKDLANTPVFNDLLDAVTQLIIRKP